MIIAGIVRSNSKETARATIPNDLELSLVLPDAIISTPLELQSLTSCPSKISPLMPDAPYNIGKLQLRHLLSMR
jgi:hypothetical protein